MFNLYFVNFYSDLLIISFLYCTFLRFNSYIYTDFYLYEIYVSCPRKSIMYTLSEGYETYFEQPYQHVDI